MAKAKKEEAPAPIEETWWKHVIAGALSGMVSRAVTAPLDRLKVLAQVTGRSFRLVHGLMELVKKDGPDSLWRGNVINTVKIMPESAVKFTTYELAKLYFLSNGNTLSVFERFYAAIFAGACCQTVIYPMEIVKTRLVAHHGHKTGLTILEVCKVVISKLGYIGFFRGYPAALGGMMLYTGTDLTVYETTKVFLHNYLDKSNEIPAYLMTASAIASSLTAQAVTYPISMSGTKLQVVDEWKTTAWKVMKERYIQHGVVGLFRGAGVSYLKTIPAVTVTYLVYENTLWRLGAEMT